MIGRLLALATSSSVSLALLKHGLASSTFSNVPVRSQLSLFVPQDIAAEFETARRALDPVQSRLIPAHVTLCREDELAGLELASLAQRLRQSIPKAITLRFGPPERFDGHGILLPSVGDTAAFQSLRAVVLATPAPRFHAPHLTLAHPRNPQAPGNTIENAAHLSNGCAITFEAVHLIEQVDSEPWVVRVTFPLLKESDSAA